MEWLSLVQLKVYFLYNLAWYPLESPYIAAFTYQKDPISVMQPIIS